MVFAVNDISFHPVHGTFSTCGASSDSSERADMLDLCLWCTGSDGTINYWDKDARTRLKCMSFFSRPHCVSVSFMLRDA